jgi:hypothetical protein
MRESPEPLFDYPVVALVKGRDIHWISVKLVGNYPVPTPGYHWPTYANQEAQQWAVMYRDGIREHFTIIDGLRLPAPRINLLD